jgi:uncharacterized protein YheU (UPF0270 family)
MKDLRENNLLEMLVMDKGLDSGRGWMSTEQRVNANSA